MLAISDENLMESIKAFRMMQSEAVLDADVKMQQMFDTL